MKTMRYLEVGQMDDLGRLDTPLHRLDARIKMVTVAVFIIAVMSFPRYEVSGLMPLFVFPFALIGVGKIPLGCIYKKVLPALPFALFVGLFNPLIDRDPMLTLGPLALSGGWLSFASILLRFTLTVSAALTLVACTGIHRLCAGLEQLGVPSLFAVQILFLYRYLFVIGDESIRMFRSVQIRSTGSKKLSLRVYCALIGHLLIRSIDRAQRIYRAMVSRGFDGQIRLLHRTQPGWRDAIFLLGWIAFFISVRHRNPARIVGCWLTGEGL